MVTFARRRRLPRQRPWQEEGSPPELPPLFATHPIASIAVGIALAIAVLSVIWILVEG